jgi:hypothetical protein
MNTAHFNNGHNLNHNFQNNENLQHPHHINLQLMRVLELYLIILAFSKPSTEIFLVYEVNTQAGRSQ